MILRGKARETAFTLVELLVVVAIVGLLVAIVVPSLGRARAAARRAGCMANLHAIGQAVQAYIGENHNFFPPMAVMPTIEPPGSFNRPMPVILDDYVDGQTEVFHCPSDRFIDPGEVADKIGADAPGGDQLSWFQWQGSSYAPMYGLSIRMVDGRWAFSRENSVTNVLAELFKDNYNDIPLMFDYEAFHPAQGHSFAAGRNILYTDMRVEPGDRFLVDADGFEG